jgi:hypothetical protein
MKRSKLKMNRIVSSIEKKKRNLRSSSDRLDGWFDDAVEPRINEISSQISDIQYRLSALNESLMGRVVNSYGEEISSDEGYGRPCDHDIEIYDEQGGLYYDQQILEEQLLSIVSMRLVYLYKNFEILLKDIISESFPEINKRDLFQWENIKAFLNSIGVIFGEIKEYQRVNEIRIVNNSIKHSNEIGEIVKKQSIPEFDEKDDFDFDSLNCFYSRTKDKPGLFLSDLAEKLIEHLYVYNDDRISKIAKDYKEKMDNSTGKKFVSALNKVFT